MHAMTKQAGTAGATFLGLRQRLFHFIRGRVSSLEDAEDLLQDVFIQFLEVAAGPDSIEEVSAWLFTVARNKITDLYRKRKKMVELPEERDGYVETPEELQANRIDAPDEVTERVMLWEEVFDALEELPVEQRDAYVKHELQGMTFEEMAEELGVAVGTLISRKYYAVQHVRQRVRELYNIA